MNIIEALKAARKDMQRKIDRLDSAIEALNGRREKHYKLSAATRKRMSESMKKRWAVRKVK